MNSKLIHPSRRVLAGLVVLLGLAAVFGATMATEGGVEPDTSQGFDVERALDHLRRFATEPRPLGSAANARTEAYLVDRLRAAGLTVEVQHAVGGHGADGLATFGRVDNIVATLPGTDPTGTVLLAAHHDSVAMGPGASDDGVAVAAMLETVRALRADGRQRNDLVLLITDGEENGLIGADAFVRRHPLGRRGGVVLNWEARGVGGPSLMFETSRDNARLVDLFTETVAHPRGDSSMVEVYRLLPNNTDFTTFAAAGFSGMNFAYIEGASRYHTAGDSIANLDRGSLQHHGENMLTLARALGATDLTTLAADHDSTYFRLLGVPVSYSYGLVWPLAVLAVLLVALLTWLARGRGLATVPGVLVGAVSVVVPLAVSALLAQGLWAALVWVRPSYDAAGGLLHRPLAYELAMMTLAVLALLGWYLLLRRRLGPTALAIGGLVWPAALGVVCAAAAPGASFLFTVPALFATLGAVVALLVPRPLWSVAAVAVGLVPATALLPYFGYMTFTAMGLSLGGVGAAFTVLFGLFTLPVVELFLRPARGRTLSRVAAPAVLLLASIALAATGLVVDSPDADHPAPTHLAYVLNADTGRAYWVSAETEPSDWTAGYVSGHDTAGLPPGYQRGELWTGAAPVIKAAAPEVEILSRTANTVTLRVKSRRAAPNLTLRLSVPITRATAKLADQNPTTVAVQGTRQDTWPAEIRLRDLPREGAELTIALKATNAKITAIDETRDLPTIPDFKPRPPNTTASTREDGDVVAVAKTYPLP